MAFSWIKSEGFDPIVDGQYPTAKSIGPMNVFRKDPYGSEIWEMNISRSNPLSLSFTTGEIKISFEGGDNFIDTKNFIYDITGDIKFDYSGTYELIDLPMGYHYYVAGTESTEVNYCGVQKIN